MSRLSAGAELVAVLGDVLLDLMDQGVALVLGLDGLAPLFVLGGIRRRILDHLSISESLRPPEAWMRICCSFAVALSLAETLTMPLASMSKRDLDLRARPRGRPRDADQVELAEQLVVRGELAARPGTPGSSPRSGCPRRSRRPGLAGRDRRVALDQAGENAARVSMPSDSGVTSSSRTS